LSPFVIAIIFILAGSKIAPSHKLKTAVVLAIIYITFGIGALFFATTSGVQVSIEMRSAGPVLGVLLGSFIVWSESRNSSSA